MEEVIQTTVRAIIKTKLLYMFIVLAAIEVIFWILKKRGPLRWCYSVITARFKTKDSVTKKKVHRK